MKFSDKTLVSMLNAAIGFRNKLLLKYGLKLEAEINGQWMPVAMCLNAQKYRVKKPVPK